MQTEIEQISPVECRVRVELPWTEVSVRLDRKLRDLRRSVRLPGYRPGKVPPKMIERLYGDSVRAELAQDLVEETFQTAVVQHEKNPLTQPRVEDASLEKGEAFSYTARFEVAPEIELQKYKEIEVRRRPRAIADDAVDQTLEQQRKAHTELRPLPEEPGREDTQGGDVWTLDLEGTLGEERITRKDVQVEIGSEENEFVPGISAALSELKLSEVGSSKSIEFEPDQERIHERFKGEKAAFTVALRDVREKHVPELDDEFAKDTGEADTLEELRTKIQEQLLERDGEEAAREARRRLVVKLLELNPFEPAPSMVARETGAQVQLFQRQLQSQGLTMAQLGMDEQTLAGRFYPEANFNVKAFLLLDAVGKAENITVSEEELSEAIEELATERGQNAARLRASMDKNQELLVLQAQLREEKILDFLMEEAEVEEAPDPEPEEESQDGDSDASAEGGEADSGEQGAEAAKED